MFIKDKEIEARLKSGETVIVGIRFTNMQEWWYFNLLFMPDHYNAAVKSFPQIQTIYLKADAKLVDEISKRFKSIEIFSGEQEISINDEEVNNNDRESTDEEVGKEEKDD